MNHMNYLAHLTPSPLWHLRYYSTWPYLATKLILDALLLRLLPVLLYAAPLYPLIGLDDLPVRVATFVMVLALFSCTIGALSIAIAALCSAGGPAMLLMNMVLLMWVLIGGFLVNTQSIPWVIRWVGG
jgi:ATP-binding cassette subfamily G (WHITE) protein 2